MWDVNDGDPASPAPPVKNTPQVAEDFLVLSRLSNNQAESPEAALPESPLKSPIGTDDDSASSANDASAATDPDTHSPFPPSFSTPAVTPTSRPAANTDRKLQVNPVRVKWLKVKSQATKLRARNSSAAALAKQPFEQSYERLQEVQVFVAKMVKDMENYLTWQKQSHTASMGLSVDLHAFYQHPDGGGSTRELLSDFSAVCDACDKNSDESFMYYEKTVISPLRVWLSSFDALRPKVDALREQHLVFDYYTAKLDALTAAAQRRAQKADANPPTEKETERLARNSTKLDIAKAAFTDGNRTLLDEMQSIHACRFVAFAPVVGAHIQFHRERTEAYAMKADRADAFYNQ
jgi:hypothetical protein